MDTDSDVGCLDHGDVVGAVADAQGYDARVGESDHVHDAARRSAKRRVKIK